MSSTNSLMNVNRDSEIHKQNSESSSRLNGETSPLSTNSKENVDHSYIQDEGTKELYLRARAQEDQIMFLRKQVALASIKESQLLNEKYALEKRFSELRMALDEKRHEAITSASNEFSHRKIDLEENIRLIHELKDAEDEKYIFMSSMLGLLSEYGIWPRVTNAFTLTSSIKHLYDQLQLKIRDSHARIAKINSMMGNQAGMGHFKENPAYSGINGQLGNSSAESHGFSPYTSGPNSENIASVPRYGQDNHTESGLLMLNDGRHLQKNGNLLNPSSESDRNVVDPIHYNYDRNGLNMQPEGNASNQFYESAARHGGFTPHGSEDGPRIEGFQIIGDAKPGCRLLGCGYPIQGTSLCMFQWVRHFPDGTVEYIEGATNPEYVVTADDVGKVIAVLCTPMDDQGRQGQLVSLFANDSNKITCDPNMQLDIDSYVSQGQASFNLLMLTDSSESWEAAILTLRRLSFQVKLHTTQVTVLAEKFSKEFSIRIPTGHSSQFVLRSSNGSSYPFSTNNDISMRDTVVLTMRIFQSKALDEKRKGRA